ncbi:MAG: sigma-70 family RNA polymerase sigma factor [Ruminococcus sp.]|nr:sigma-70 family RNA polymerase sigma factor [Ruminococcus sp.]
MTDTEWVELFERSPKKAYTALVEDYGGLVYTIAVNRLGSCATRQDAEDCTSEIFLEIFRSAERFSPETGSLKAFISTIARRRATDAFRSLSRRYSLTGSADDEETMVLPAPDDVEEEADRKLLRDELWEKVRALGEPDSAVIIYRYFYRLTAAETAKRLSMSAAAVEKRCQRARKKLRDILSRE